MNQEDRILEMLREAGNKGVSNFDLMHVAFQYPARIHALRHKRGHEISSVHVNDKEWRITLIKDAEEPQPSVQQPLF